MLNAALCHPQVTGLDFAAEMLDDAAAREREQRLDVLAPRTAPVRCECTRAPATRAPASSRIHATNLAAAPPLGQRMRCLDLVLSYSSGATGSAPPARACRWVQGDALSLPFESGGFDAATMGYGLRNVADIPRALRELHRVLKPGGLARKEPLEVR